MAPRIRRSSQSAGAMSDSRAARRQHGICRLEANGKLLRANSQLLSFGEGLLRDRVSSNTLSRRWLRSRFPDSGPARHWRNHVDGHPGMPWLARLSSTSARAVPSTSTLPVRGPIQRAGAQRFKRTHARLKHGLGWPIPSGSVKRMATSSLCENAWSLSVRLKWISQIALYSTIDALGGVKGPRRRDSFAYSHNLGRVQNPAVTGSSR